MSIFRSLKASLLVTVVSVATVQVAVCQQNVSAEGIWAQGRDLVLFANLFGCSAEPHSAQIFASTDAGKSWQKRGPALEGSAFEFLLQEQNDLWIAGEHISEGLGYAPFVLIPTGATFEWNMHIIYNGPASIEQIAKRGKHLSALLRIYRVERPNNDGYTVLFESADGGSHWRQPHSAKAVQGAEMSLFQSIPKDTPEWKTETSEDGTLAIQHKANAQSSCETVSTFKGTAGCKE